MMFILIFGGIIIYGGLFILTMKLLMIIANEFGKLHDWMVKRGW